MSKKFLAALKLPDQPTKSAGAVPMTQLGSSNPFDVMHPQHAAFDPDDDIDQFFPVTLNGKTREMIEEELKRASIDYGFAAATQQASNQRYAAAKKTLAPLALKIEAMLKVPIAQTMKDVQQNTNPAIRNIARRAMATHAGKGTAETLLDTVRDLADNSKAQVVSVGMRVQAAKDLDKASEMREQAKEMMEAFEALDKMIDMGFDLATGEELAVAKSATKIAFWFANAFSEADRLTEAAKKLEAHAKELTDDALKKDMASAIKVSRDLVKDLKKAEKNYQENSEAEETNAKDAAHVYDTQPSAKRKNKNPMNFTQFRAALAQQAGLIVLLTKSIGELESNARDVLRRGKTLGDLMIAPGRCASHHDHAEKYPDFKPDPARVAKETAELKALVKKELVELAAMKKAIDDEHSEMLETVGFEMLRDRDWNNYYAAASKAYYASPES